MSLKRAEQSFTGAEGANDRPSGLLDLKIQAGRAGQSEAAIDRKLFAVEIDPLNLARGLHHDFARALDRRLKPPFAAEQGSEGFVAPHTDFDCGIATDIGALFQNPLVACQFQTLVLAKDWRAKEDFARPLIRRTKDVLTRHDAFEKAANRRGRGGHFNLTAHVV